MPDATPAPEVRRLRDADRDRWASLYAGYLTFYERPVDPVAVERVWARLRADADVHALGASADGRLVGFVHFLLHANVNGPDVCYLQDLFTDPTARGRGVGRALIAAVAETARARGAGRVYWLTHESNTTARRLYDTLAAHRGFIRYELDL